jgi:release factor glutamine methyltransferase
MGFGLTDPWPNRASSIARFINFSWLMTLKDIHNEIVDSLISVYDKKECEFLCRIVLRERLDMDFIHLISNPRLIIGKDLRSKIDNDVRQLLQHKPIQYIYGKTDFYGRRFQVDEQVLIPRPETEELCRWVIESLGSDFGGSILDIGTGSGCIAITLSRELPSAKVLACDISHSALEVAKRNADLNDAVVYFFHKDILNDTDLHETHVIVSNPPYVKETERKAMHKNVTEFEPSGALFVPDDDPLVFYRRIVLLAEKFTSKPLIFFEIHENTGEEIRRLLSDYGYDPKIRKDLNGKERMVKALPRL